jgi:hypothetical protein
VKGERRRRGGEGGKMGVSKRIEESREYSVILVGMGGGVAGERREIGVEVRAGMYVVCREW